VIAQKMRLRLLDKSLGFSRFSTAYRNYLCLRGSRPERTETAAAVGRGEGGIRRACDAAHIRFMQLDSKKIFIMTATRISLDGLVAKSK